jgi:hypothetical protein
MKENVEVANHYEVFINARLYVRHEKDQSSEQVREAKEYLKICRDRFVNKHKKEIKLAQLEDKD